MSIGKENNLGEHIHEDDLEGAFGETFGNANSTTITNVDTQFADELKNILGKRPSKTNRVDEAVPESTSIEASGVVHDDVDEDAVLNTLELNTKDLLKVAEAEAEVEVEVEAEVEAEAEDKPGRIIVLGPTDTAVEDEITVVVCADSVPEPIANTALFIANKKPDGEVDNFKMITPIDQNILKKEETVKEDEWTEAPVAGLFAKDSEKNEDISEEEDDDELIVMPKGFWGRHWKKAVAAVTMSAVLFAGSYYLMTNDSEDQKTAISKNDDTDKDINNGDVNVEKHINKSVKIPVAEHDEANWVENVESQDSKENEWSMLFDETEGEEDELLAESIAKLQAEEEAKLKAEEEAKKSTDKVWIGSILTEKKTKRVKRGDSWWKLAKRNFPEHMGEGNNGWIATIGIYVVNNWNAETGEYTKSMNDTLKKNSRIKIPTKDEMNRLFADAEFRAEARSIFDQYHAERVAQGKISAEEADKEMLAFDEVIQSLQAKDTTIENIFTSGALDKIIDDNINVEEALEGMFAFEDAQKSKNMDVADAELEDALANLDWGTGDLELDTALDGIDWDAAVTAAMPDNIINDLVELEPITKTQATVYEMLANLDMDDDIINDLVELEPIESTQVADIIMNDLVDIKPITKDQANVYDLLAKLDKHHKKEDLKEEKGKIYDDGWGEIFDNLYA